ncbi:hypothetical protein KY321_02410, partial [Candidatus Woesearchaeota archaeon]|nr:hypothetical protein [Candidatus Woesearchaeota archaeon]
SIFQYMIGNSDFSVSGRHNLKLLKSKDYKETELIPIPYDLDYSGLVNAHYAVPSDKIPIEEVTQRFYRGLCRNDDLYNYVLDIFREKKDEIYSFIESFEYLDKKSQKYILKYISDFYDEIERDNFIKKKIRPTCSS